MAMNKFRKSSISSGGKCAIGYTVDGECRGMWRKTREVVVRPTCFRLTFACCWFCLPNIQCFPSCTSWIPLAFSVMSVMP